MTIGPFELDMVVNMDCLDAMRQMPDGCVDLVWCDIPYNVGKNYGTVRDDYADAEYLGLVGQWIAGMKRVSNNRIALYTPQKYIQQIWGMLGPDFRQIILSYSPEGAIRWGFNNQFSSILVNVKPITYTKNVWHNCQIPGLGFFFRENIWGHPGYTSEDVTERVIAAFTKRGEIILDPFMGSGTTAVICHRTDRRFIGFEKDPGSFAIANKRIENERAQLRLEI